MKLALAGLCADARAMGAEILQMGDEDDEDSF